MVLAMASQDAQNFFQPLSSWISRVYETLQQAGDVLSASLVNLSKQDSKLNDRLDQDLDNIQTQETYFEDEEQSNDWSQEDTNSLFLEVDHFSCCNSDLQDSAQSSSPRLSQHAKDSCSIISQWPNQTHDDQKPPHVLSSIAEEEHHLEKQRSGLPHGFESQLSCTLENVYGKKQGKLASNHFLWVLPKDISTRFIFIYFSCHMTFIFSLLYLSICWLFLERCNPQEYFQYVNFGMSIFVRFIFQNKSSKQVKC